MSTAPNCRLASLLGDVFFIPNPVEHFRYVTTSMRYDMLKPILKKLHFPATKNQVVQQALHRGADDDIFNLLRQLPMGMYRNPDQILKILPEAQGNAFWKIFNQEP